MGMHYYVRGIPAAEATRHTQTRSFAKHAYARRDMDVNPNGLYSGVAIILRWLLYRLGNMPSARRVPFWIQQRLRPHYSFATCGRSIISPKASPLTTIPRWLRPSGYHTFTCLISTITWPPLRTRRQTVCLKALNRILVQYMRTIRQRSSQKVG